MVGQRVFDPTQVYLQWVHSLMTVELYSNFRGQGIRTLEMVRYLLESL
jgi:hypothetical protein